MNENFDIMYSPPAPVGRPSKAYLAQKALRQQRRMELLNLLRQAHQPPADDPQPPPNATQTPPNATQTPPNATQTPPNASQTPPTATQPPPTAAQPSPHRYRNFTLAFKVHVATYAETHSIRATAQHFGLDRRTVRTWLNNRSSHNANVNRQTSYRVARDHVGQFADMEVQLYDYVIDQRDQGFCVTGGMIRAEALRLLAGSNFQASNGWLTRFLRRHRLTMRRITRF
jgi:hypothetical protein